MRLFDQTTQRALCPVTLMRYMLGSLSLNLLIFQTVPVLNKPSFESSVFHAKLNIPSLPAIYLLTKPYRYWFDHEAL